MERDYFGFCIIKNDKELQEAINKKEILIAFICPCCNKKKVVRPELYNTTCEERNNKNQNNDTSFQA